MTDITLEERIDRLERFVSDLMLHKDSRRGVEGARGPAGEPSKIPGPKGDTGAPGKDADIAQLIETARVIMLEELNQIKSSLSQIIVQELINAGALDSNGRAILIEGPAGRDGSDSTVPGPAGRDGVDSQVPGPAGRDGVDSQVAGPKGDKGDNGVDGTSIVGPPGRDAKIQIGSVITGSDASVTLREENGVQILDFVIPRGEAGRDGASGADSTVPGPQGDKGDSIEGPQGLPGTSLTRHDIAKIILDMKSRGAI